MSKSESVTYHCDKCGKKLKTCDNELHIITEGKAYGQSWQRLHLQVIYAHGMHNDGDEEQADLCQSCAIELLSDALKRVKAGERATAGYSDSDQENWE